MIFSINESMISNNDISVVREDYEGLSFYESSIQMYTEITYELDNSRLLESYISGIINSVESWLSKILGVIDRFRKEIMSKLQIIRTKFIKPNADNFNNTEWTKDCEFEDYDYRKIDKFINAELPNPESNGSDDYFRADHEHGTDKIGYRNRNEIFEHVLGKKITIDARYIHDIDPINVINSFKKELEQIKTQEKKILLNFLKKWLNL